MQITVPRIYVPDPTEHLVSMMRDFAQNPYIKGTRLTFHRPIDRNWMIDGTNDWYWPLAEELGLVTMVHAPIWKAELGAIADRQPGLKIIIDHMGIMARCVDIMTQAPRSELIWASPREILNLVQADQVGCHIITITHDLLKKLDCLGKSLEQYSLETVRMFHGDAVAAGFTL